MGVQYVPSIMIFVNELDKDEVFEEMKKSSIWKDIKYEYEYIDHENNTWVFSYMDEVLGEYPALICEDVYADSKSVLEEIKRITGDDTYKVEVETHIV